MSTYVSGRRARPPPSSIPSSLEPLGGLPIILFLGDFKQFEPVRDTPGRPWGESHQGRKACFANLETGQGRHHPDRTDEAEGRPSVPRAASTG